MKFDPPPRQAPLWRGDSADLPALFGVRFAGGRDPMTMAAPSEWRDMRPRIRFLDTDGEWRLRVATADAYGHRRTA